MEGKKLIHAIRLRNFLSYKDTSEGIPLEPLNVLIGRNATGKSNLLEAIGLLHAAPNNLSYPIQQGGGITEWLWKGRQTNEPDASIATIEAIVDYPDGPIPLLYHLEINAIGPRQNVLREIIQNNHPQENKTQEIDVFYSSVNSQSILSIQQLSSAKAGIKEGRETLNYTKTPIEQESSVLSLRKDTFHFPEITYLGNIFQAIHTYKNINLKRNSIAQFPQKADLPDDFLLEDGSNLGLVLDDLVDKNGVLQRIIKELGKFYNSAESIRPKIRGNSVELFIYETGLSQPVSTYRLSDGTLRYLCLLTILCHPEPPPLICIEEPELGLHPDVLPNLAKLLIAASQRTQLIVTTHSEALVSALSEVPEAILVCERDEEGTHLRRLEPEKLRDWLKDYTLGDLWAMGEIGGN
jgi:predicted ATPase